MSETEKPALPKWSETSERLGVAKMAPPDRLKAFESWQNDVGSKLLSEGSLDNPDAIRKWKSFELKEKRRLADNFFNKATPQEVNADFQKWSEQVSQQPRIDVDPTLIRNPEKYREAVLGSDASFDAKMLALADRPSREKEHAYLRRKELSGIVAPHSQDIVDSLQESQELFGLDLGDVAGEIDVRKDEAGNWTIPTSKSSGLEAVGKNFLPLSNPGRLPLKELKAYQEKWGLSDDEVKKDYTESLKAVAPTEANRWLFNKKDLETISPELKGQTRIINQDIGVPEIAVPKSPELLFKKDEYDKLVDSTDGATDEMKQRAKEQRVQMARQTAPDIYNALLENRKDFGAYTLNVDKAKGTDAPEEMRKSIEKFYQDKRDEGSLASANELLRQFGKGIERGTYQSLATPSALLGLMGNKTEGEKAAMAARFGERSSVANKMASPNAVTQFAADFGQMLPDLAAQVVTAIGTAGAANVLTVGKLAATTGVSRSAATRALQIAARTGGELADTTAMMGRAGLSEALAKPAISAYKELTSKNLIKGVGGRQMLYQSILSGASQGANTYADSLNRFKDAGMSSDDAHQAARINGAVAGGITALVTTAFGVAGHGGLEKPFDPKTYTVRDLVKTGIWKGVLRDAGDRALMLRTAKAFGKDIADEALEEGIDQFLQGIAAYGTDPTKEAQDKTFSEVLAESTYASALGAAGGFTGSIKGMATSTLPDGTTRQDVMDQEGMRAAIKAMREEPSPASATIQGEVTADDVVADIDEKIKQTATTAAEVAADLSENEDTSKTAEALSVISQDISPETGIMSPWRLQYVIQSPESPPSESTPTEEVSPTEGDRYPSETVSGDSGSDVGQLSENIETPQREEVNTGNTIEVQQNRLKRVSKKGSEFVKEKTKMTREQAVVRVATLQTTDKILSALRACVGKG